MRAPVVSLSRPSPPRPEDPPLCMGVLPMGRNELPRRPGANPFSLWRLGGALTMRARLVGLEALWG